VLERAAVLEEVQEQQPLECAQRHVQQPMVYEKLLQLQRNLHGLRNSICSPSGTCFVRVRCSCVGVLCGSLTRSGTRARLTCKAAYAAARRPYD
jgi:hypothetical protein